MNAMVRGVIFFLLLFLFPQIGEADLVNQIVAVYNKKSITLWDVHREIQIERLNQGLSLLQTVPLNDLKAMTKKMIVENLVVEEAMSFHIASMSEDEKEKELNHFRARFQSKDSYSLFLKTYGWTEADLAEILVRPHRVEQFLKEKIMSAYIFISPDEKEAYKRGHPSLSAEEVSDRLHKKKVRENLNDWIGGLKVRNEIQTFWDE